MDLKKILKTLKLRQQEISTILGIIILLIAGLFVINYVKNFKNQNKIPVKEENLTQNQNQTHIVLKKETLWSISQKYYKKGSDWKKIADANNISDPNKLEVGQNLTIPNSEVVISTKRSPSPKPQITEKAASTTSEINENTYTVVKGDNLWKIAIRAYGDGYKWTEIAKANNLHNPNLIHPGNVFVIPR
jgi:nucleoid-associated protein YgaU